MDSQHYFTIKLQGVKASDEDLLTAELFEMGAAGVQEDLQFLQTLENFQPSIIESKIKTLIVYFEKPPAFEATGALLARYPGIDIEIEQHQNKDWLSEWKKDWKAFELVPGHWVVPPWLDRREDNYPSKLLIEPGMAFGTGTHETTQLAAQLIKDLCSQEEITSLLDVGTGSGILAMLARQLGVKNVFAYDNDPESLRVFQENLERNQLNDILWEKNWSHELAGEIDLTVANIIDGVLLSLKEDFQKLQSPFYIFTGILLEREANFLSEMLSGWSLQVQSRLQRGEWVGFTLRRLS